MTAPDSRLPLADALTEADHIRRCVTVFAANALNWPTGDEPGESR